MNQEKRGSAGASLASTDQLATQVSRMADLGVFTDQLVDSCLRTISSGSPILVAGNGGSYADAAHTVAEFTGRLEKERDPLPAIVLGANQCSSSAIGNDYSFEEGLTREFKAFSGLAVTLWIFSTSGESRNLARLAAESRARGIPTFALLGKDGGQCAKLCRSFIVPSQSTTAIQEIHMMIAHAVCRDIDERLSEIA